MSRVFAGSRLIRLPAAVLFLGLSLSACSSPEQKAQDYYTRGHELLEKGDYVKAGLEFKNALQLKKNMIQAWRGLLVIEEHNNNFAGSVPILRNIIELDANDLGARLKLGHILLAGKQLDQALDLANAAKALQPNSADALALRAAVLFKLNDRAGANSEAEEALKIDPKNADALIVLAGEHVADNDLKAALDILSRPQATDQNNLALDLFRLDVLQKLGNGPDAEALLRKLIQRYPKELGFRQALVNFYIQQKRPDAAERELRAVVEANLSDVSAGLRLVQFLRQTKGPDAARQQLMSFINAGVQAFKYEIALADLDASLGQQDAAIKRLEKLASQKLSKEDLATVKLELAQLQINAKNYDAAQTLVSEVLENDERNTGALKLRAVLSLVNNRTDAAIADLRQALNDQPRSSDLMILLASAYERSGSVDLAEKQLADATQVANFAPAVALTYSAFLRRHGEISRAEEVVAEATRRQPSNLQLLGTLAEIRLSRQNWAGAQEVGQMMQRVGGGGAAADQILAASLSGQGKLNDSVKLLESLHDAEPNAVQPMISMVSTLTRAGKRDEAISFLQKILKQDPGNVTALVLTGDVYWEQKDFEKAEANFKSAVEKQPDNGAGYSALGLFYLRRNDIDRAEQIVRKGLQHAPNNIDLHSRLADIAQVKGQVDVAISEYEAILKLDPGSVVAANNLASLLSDYKTDQASLDRAYQVALMLNRTPVPSFQDTLGWVYYLRGDKKEAMKLLEQAAKALPERAAVQYHLGVAYGADGQAAKAREQFQKALKLNPNKVLEAQIKAAEEKVASSN